MDFVHIKERSTKNGVIEVYPDFVVGRSSDLMVRGKSFYAVWHPHKGLWSTDEYDVQTLVDEELAAYRDKIANRTDATIVVRWLRDFSSTSWKQFRSYMSLISDSSTQLDEKLTFSNTVVQKNDYVSKRLPYPLEVGDISAYEELIGTLYNPEERAKLEWAVGSIVAGDAKDIQKFVVLYGEGGSGKSTFLNIVQSLFKGYYASFEAQELTSKTNSFATEAFRSNPLVAIQHDGNLSRIEDNTKLNSIVSHEEIVINEKFKPSYMARVNCMLFMGTNSPVRITDAKSGIIRRLIDVRPSGNRVSPRRYQVLMSQIQFELGAIAQHCLEVYRGMGKDYYSGYRPVDMMLKTDVFYNYVEENFHLFNEQNGATLTQAYDLYKQYCDDALVDFKLPKHKFREELKNYFANFNETFRLDGKQVRSYYSGFLSAKFTSMKMKVTDEPLYSLVLDEEVSLLDEYLAECPAQLAGESGFPRMKWTNNETTLSQIDSKELHYVKPPDDHIVIDFDLVDADGNRSLEYNLAAASKWPATYAEFSKSGAGIHLHYRYDGDPSQLSRVYSDGVEIKVFRGDASLRRKLSRCNNVPVATINTGLPLKEVKMINHETVKSERGLRELILRNLNKEIHNATKPSVDFIHKILEEAYESGISYDVTDLRPRILAFANNSTNQSGACLKLVATMKFKSEEPSPDKGEYNSDNLVFFDVEVFPNLFVICWKHDGKGDECVRMINPKPQDIEALLQMKLVGFNCRRYDNHILYARYMGYSNAQLYEISQRLINNSKNGTFAEAYALSYTDVYDFASKKQTLKKWEIELGVHHHELGLPWDQPVPEDQWDLVAEYCENDVRATEAVFHARHEDFVARQILAKLSGLTVNDTTQKHTAKIIFGDDKTPQDKFVYTDLATGVRKIGNREIEPDTVIFPGYTYEFGKSLYRGLEPSEGGYVYAEPGMYENVAVIDVASMHPTSIRCLEAFGEYTERFGNLVDARLAIKRGDTDALSRILGRDTVSNIGEEDLKGLSYALKIAINIVYGLTSAKFDNPFRDIRNKDNIVAKRGALFMIDLQNFVQDKGFAVAHIKTDSIKIPNATPEIIEEVMEFGKKYGYTFEHEATYDKMCLVNDAVYIAKKGEEWEAVGAQFQHPYVYKTLFTKKPIEFSDMRETKSVATALYLDMNEGLPEGEHAYRFVGRAGEFTPMLPGAGGGILLREKDGEYNAATGTKGYRWMESEMVEKLAKTNDIDRSYYNKLVDAAAENISKYGDLEWFVS